MRYKEVCRNWVTGSGACSKGWGQGVDWSHYKHPLPEHVYDVYMRYWGTRG
ncbi:MAG: hypothetical protein ACXV3D_07815 [Halobacteriota archaeon]